MHKLPSCAGLKVTLMEEKRIADRVLVRKPERKRDVGRPRRRLEINNKLDVIKR
jgi:hypothetical protein